MFFCARTNYFAAGVTRTFSPAARPKLVSWPATVTVTMPASARLATMRPADPNGNSEGRQSWNAGASGQSFLPD